jgi:nucleoside-diphosphate-sugar epimerase
VIPTIITQALRADTVRLGSLTPTRDLTYVTDTARGFLLAAGGSRRSIGQVVQLGTGAEMSIGEIVTRIGRILGCELNVVPDKRRRRPRHSEVERLIASTDKARTMLGWRPTISFDEGLARTIEWFRSRPGRYKYDLYNV